MAMRLPPIMARDAAADLHSVILGIVFAASGAAALIYQVLWLRQLAVIFGNTAQATAATLSIFFLGLALGAYRWGARAERSPSPLRGFAGLELAIATTALSYFVLLDVYRAVYPVLAAALQDAPVVFQLCKLGLAAMALLPPTFFMGGTLPYMSQHAVRYPQALGRTVSWLYACNTLGGAAGALAAAFVLVPSLGYSRSYVVALALNAIAAVAALVLRRPALIAAAAVGDTTRGVGRAAPAAIGARDLAAVACFSGAATLGLEVMWTRMFAQVLHNSVYSFAAILGTFLIALALGSAAAHGLWRTSLDPARVLPVLLIIAGCAAGLSPFAFFLATDGLRYVAPAAGWWEYLRSVLTVAGLVLIPAGIALGLVFPYVLGMAAGRIGAGAGGTVGRLVAWNTVGSIAGALVAGFVLIDRLGLWGGFRAVAAAYLALAVVVMPGSAITARPVRAALASAIVGVLVLFDPSRLAVVSVLGADEFVREKWETGHAIVAVTQSGPHRLLKLDNFYSLGGTSAMAYEEAQADVPLIVHPRAQSVYFLGLGTGITAGAALRHDVASVTAVELIPEVVTASRRHFAPFVNGLFEDARAVVIAEDGRQFLLRSEQRYDVIISDLFIPWQAGTGSLYTVEHFELVRSRLREGGLFAQWLPLYQLVEADFRIIVRTMLEVFPQVTLWRGDFTPNQPIVALIGQDADARLEPEAVTENFRTRRRSSDLTRDVAMALAGLFYAGNLGENRALFAGVAVNTDDRPIIEYQAPISQRRQAAGDQPWLTSLPLALFQAELLRNLPPAMDPYLSLLDATEHEYVLAGMDLFSAIVQRQAGNGGEAQRHAESFRRSVPDQVYAVFRSELEVEKEKSE